MVVNFDNLSSCQLKIFNSIKEEVLIDYNELVSKLLDLNTQNEYWVFSNVAGRNTFHSKTYYYLCCLNLIEKLEKTEPIEAIVTNDFILKKTLTNYYNIRCNKKTWIHKLIKNRPHIKSYYHYIRWCLGGYRSKNKQRAKQFYKTKNIIIVDTFIAVKTNKYDDRYYGSIFDLFSHDVQNRTYYLAQYLPIPQKKDTDAIAGNSSENIIYLFDFLNLLDYVKSLFFRLKFNEPSWNDYIYLKYPLKYILHDDFSGYIGYYYCSTILYERIIKKFAKKKLSLNLIVDWFENQSYDKALYYFLHKYMPTVKIHGYIGFMPDFCATPHNLATNRELELNIAPKNLFVCNQAIKDIYMKSGYKGSINIAPFFRAQQVWNIKRNKDANDSFIVLVPMGLDNYEVEYKISFFTDFITRYKGDKAMQILLKPHPVYRSIDTSIGKYNSNLKIVDGDIYEYLQFVNAVIAANSTVTFEALAMGIPVISLKDNIGKLKIDRPDVVPQFMWYDVANEKDFTECVVEVDNIREDERMKFGEILRSYFFEQISIDGVNKLFALD